MSFDYLKFRAESGTIALDLSPNQDSFTIVLSYQNNGDF